MPHFSTDTYVAVLALAISAIALWLALKTDRELRVVSAATADISKNLTTRYIGEFPSYLPDIVDVLGAADHNILIATDLPGYASYTNHDAYLDYKAAIDKRQGTRVEITMMVLDEPLRKSILDIQFKGEAFESLSKTEQYKRFVRWAALDASAIKDVDAFVRAVCNEQLRTLNDDFRRLTRVEVHSHLPMHLWIADDKAAVFSVPILEPGARAAGFLTRDARLIEQLSAIFGTYKRTSDSLHRPNSV